jgi:hypothetical protein
LVRLLLVIMLTNTESIDPKMTRCVGIPQVPKSRCKILRNRYNLVFALQRVVEDWLPPTIRKSLVSKHTGVFVHSEPLHLDDIRSKQFEFQGLLKRSWFKTNESRLPWI